MKLIEALRAKPNGNQLAERLLRDVRPVALTKLEHFRDLFPHFTDHSMRHSDGVLSVLDWLLPDAIKDALNEWELYLLVAAVYLHDIGMVEGCPGTPSGAAWEGFLNDFQASRRHSGATDVGAMVLQAKRHYVRDHHHERSEEYIRDQWAMLGLRETDTPAEGRIVARIALGHRQCDLADRTFFGQVAFGNNQPIRRDLLAAYLRLADELDTTAFRTPWAEYEVLSNYDERTALEWAKHLSLSGVKAAHGVITLTGECHDHGVYLRLLALHEDIKAKLQEIKRMLPRPYTMGDLPPIPDPMPYQDVALDIEHVGYLPIKVQFELQDREVTRLIMGERLYGDPTACLRELLQNAVDTCREAREQRAGGWTPQIEVTEGADGTTIVVADNGMGMDEYIVRQYFARVGISYYRSADFTGSFRPASEFGIGILSCFMLADRIEVDSLRAGAAPIHLDISDLTAPFVPSPGRRKGPGTSVRLHFKAEQIGKIDVLERVRHFARHVDIPIAITNRGGAKEVVCDRGLDAEVLDAFVGRPVAADEGLLAAYRARQESIFRECYAERREGGVELGIALTTDVPPCALSVPETPGLWLEHQGGRLRFLISRVSQQGFFVGEFEEQFHQFAWNTWCELNIRDERLFTLTADRTRIGGDAGAAWRKVADLYTACLEDLYRRFQHAGRKHRKADSWRPWSNGPVRWWEFHLNHYARSLPQIPAALEQAAKAGARFCAVTRTGFHCWSLDDVRRWSGAMHFVPIQGHANLEYVLDLLPPDGAFLVLPLSMSDFYLSGDHWFWKLIGREAETLPDGMLRKLCVKMSRHRIDGQARWFFDAGKPVGTWRLSERWAMPRPYSGAGSVFDIHHPFSKLLLERCQLELPRQSSLELRELFRLASRRDDQEIARRQGEVVRALKVEGIIPQDEPFDPGAPRPLSGHTCPYGAEPNPPR